MHIHALYEFFLRNIQIKHILINGAVYFLTDVLYPIMS